MAMPQMKVAGLVGCRLDDTVEFLTGCHDRRKRVCGALGDSQRGYLNAALIFTSPREFLVEVERLLALDDLTLATALVKWTMGWTRETRQQSALCESESTQDVSNEEDI